MNFGSLLGSGDDPKEAASAHAQSSMRAMLGPQAFDNAIRQAISLCWMLLPESKKSVAELEAEVRRVVERALTNLREDARVFGIPTDTTDTPRP